MTQVVTTPGQTTDPRDDNPGYRPEQTDGPLLVAPADARTRAATIGNPTQTWPTFPDDASPLTGWRTVDAADRGTYEIPSGWTYREGVFSGYETVRGVSDGAVYVSKDRADQCGGMDAYGFLALISHRKEPRQPRQRP